MVRDKRERDLFHQKLVCEKAVCPGKVFLIFCASSKLRKTYGHNDGIKVYSGVCHRFYSEEREKSAKFFIRVNPQFVYRQHACPFVPKIQTVGCDVFT